MSSEVGSWRLWVAGGRLGHWEVGSLEVGGRRLEVGAQFPTEQFCQNRNCADFLFKKGNPESSESGNFRCKNSPGASAEFPHRSVRNAHNRQVWHHKAPQITTFYNHGVQAPSSPASVAAAWCVTEVPKWHLHSQKKHIGATSCAPLGWPLRRRCSAKWNLQILIPKRSAHTNLWWCFGSSEGAVAPSPLI